MRTTATTKGRRSDRTRSDRELLAAWRSGDRHSRNRLLDRHFAAVFGFFRNRGHDAAEDLTQQTFLQCLEALENFRNEATFRTYLFAIARNMLYEDLRRRARQRGGVCEAGMIDLGLSPSDVLELREDHELLVQALRELPAELQRALELYYVQRLRGRHLVTSLGLPPGTVRSRIRRGIERLRVEMTELARAPNSIG
jgi:RNA polymerase sigma-70 factor (ECF subfamily)